MATTEPMRPIKAPDPRLTDRLAEKEIHPSDYAQYPTSLPAPCRCPPRHRESDSGARRVFQAGR